MNLKHRLVRLKRQLTDNPVPSFADETEGQALTAALELVGTTVPAGCLGLHFGRRTSFDLGFVMLQGRILHGVLPIYQDLVLGEDLEDLGEWDGTQGEITKMGWQFNPILQQREYRAGQR